MCTETSSFLRENMQIRASISKDRKFGRHTTTRKQTTKVPATGVKNACYAFPIERGSCSDCRESYGARKSTMWEHSGCQESVTHDRIEAKSGAKLQPGTNQDIASYVNGREPKSGMFYIGDSFTHVDATPL